MPKLTTAFTFMTVLAAMLLAGYAGTHSVPRASQQKPRLARPPHRTA